jgi:hypothetical protein
LVSLCALNAYFLITVGWRVLWSSEVTYMRRFMIGETPFLPVLSGSVTWEQAPVLAPILFVCFALPLVYPASLAACWIAARRRRLTEERVVVLVALTGSALFLEVSLSPSWLREYAVAMPGVVLLAWWVDRLDVGTPLRRGCMAFGWLAAVSSGVAQTAARQHTQYVVTDLPAGTAAVPLATSEKVRLVMSRTRPGQFYFQAIWPGLYAPLRLRNPTYVDVVGRDEATRPEFIARAVDDLEAKRVEYILWAPFLERPEPGRERAYHLAPLVRYLHARYARVEILQDGEELWRRLE